MDKFEYKVRAEEIKSLIAQGDYVQAAEIADSIDWRRVKSVMMLCTISDLYKINRRYEDARDMLLLAYDRHPGGRTIVYSLCELSIKMDEFVQAVEYYKEFVQSAPKDPGRYILQYKLYEAQDVSLEERIAVLEELKKRDYREKWAYELAYLYHRVGLSTRCVEECDELILWFGDGKYVIKAMELKMLHQPLTPQQQQKYEYRFAPHYEQHGYVQQEERVEQQIEQQAQYQQSMPQYQQPEQQAQYGQSMPQQSGQQMQYQQPMPQYQQAEQQMQYRQFMPQYQQAEQQAQYGQSMQHYQQPEQPDEFDIHVKTMDVSQYNTINLQKELAEGLKEVLGEQDPMIADPITRSIVAPMFEGDTESLDQLQIEEVEDESLEPEVQESEVFFGETEEIKDVEQALENIGEEPIAEEPAVEEAPVEKTVEASEDECANSEDDQITGQLSIDDIMAEWARLKREAAGEEDELWVMPAKAETVAVSAEEEAAEEETVEEETVEEETAEDETAGDEIVVAEDAETVTPVAETMIDESEELVEIEEADPAEEVEQPGEYAAETYEEMEQPEEYAAEAYEETEQSGEYVAEVYEETEQPGEYPTETYEEMERPEDYAADAYEEAEQPEDYVAEAYEEAEQPEDYAAEAYEETEQPEYAPESYEETEQSDIYTEDEYPENKIIEDTIQDEVDQDEMSCVDETQKEPQAEAQEEIQAEAQDEIQAESPKQADPVKKAPQTEEKQGESAPTQEPPRVRSLTKEERELFGQFVQNRSTRQKLITVLDRISLAAYTGNVIITGDENMDTMGLAKNIIRDVQMTDGNFSGKTAKITGASLNKKDAAAILEHLKNGALIIQKASGINDKTAGAMYRKLQQDSMGIIVVLEDTKKNMNRFLEHNKQLAECFNARMDMEALSNEALVLFGKKYAREMEYSIDELGVLALHTRIEDMQTIDHAVTIMEVKEIVDDAIDHASRKTIKHFFDVLLGKGYDEEDMIILRENDFV